MRDMFINNVITSLASRYSSEELSFIKIQLIKNLENVELTKRVTDLAEVSVIPDFVKTYIVSRKIEGLSDGTLKLYLMRLKQFFEIINKPVDQIDGTDIRLFLYNFQHSRNIGNESLDAIRTVLSTFFKWAVAEGYLEKDPTITIKPIRYEKKQRKYLSEIEIELLRGACNSLRECAILETFYSTGCRVSEVANMKTSDIDFSSGEIDVLGKGNKHRTVYLNPRAKIALQKYINSRDDDNVSLFVSIRKPHCGLTKAGIEKVIKQLGERAGIQRRVFPHLIRHTTATHALYRGMPITNVQKILGHSSLDTTMIYAKVANEDVKNSHSKCIV